MWKKATQKKETKKTAKKVTKKVTKKVEHFERMNKLILEDLKNHNIPWRKPWKENSNNLPRNFETQKCYRGYNFMTLWQEDYNHSFFLTLKQIEKKKLKLKPNQRGHQIYFYKKLEIEDEKNEDKTKTIPMLKEYIVYNVSQLENMPKKLKEVEEESLEKINNIKITTFVKNLNVKMKHSKNKAYFNYSENYINMPYKKNFKSDSHFLDTLFHELIHWSGHSSRLNRNMLGSMGSEVYSREELVAEIGGSYLCSIFGIDNSELIENSKSYIKGWSQKIKEDKTIFVKACHEAQLAVDFLLDKANIQID